MQTTYLPLKHRDTGAIVHTATVRSDWTSADWDTLAETFPQCDIPRPQVKYKACCSCRNGDHDYSGPDVRMTTVRDPDTGKLVLRGYICDDHATMFLDDGYTVKLG